MWSKFLTRLFLFFLLASFVAVFFILISLPAPVVLDPKGPIAWKERLLLAKSTWLMLWIVLPVFLLTFFFVWRYREGGKGTHKPNVDTHLWTEVVCWGVPFILISILSVWVWKGCHELDPFRPLNSKQKPLVIEVIALQWKWLFLYPEHQIATVNFLQIPTHAPVTFKITADAPMNSFWIPQLGGQIYAMAGMESRLHLIAEQEGHFRGSSANLSGDGFAGMVFTTKASTEEEFLSWVQSIQNQQPSLEWISYQSLKEPSTWDPPSFYRLTDLSLYSQVIEQYTRGNS